MKFGSITTPIITDGLVFNMDAANRASYVNGNTNAFNTINFSQSGSLDSGAAFSSENLGVFTFDGVDERILLNTTMDDIFTTLYWSVDVWWNTNGNNSYDAILGNGYPVQLYKQGSKIRSYLSSNASSGTYFLNDMTSTQNISANTWYHLIWIRDSTNYYYYINGVLDKTATSATTAVAAANVNFNIGNLWNTSNAYTWDGEIGPVHIYNRSLSASEVLHNYNALKSRFGL